MMRNWRNAPTENSATQNILGFSNSAAQNFEKVLP